jgi:hypothetical protein
VEVPRDGIGLCDVESLDVNAICPAPRARAGGVDVDVGYGLVRWDAVVLPGGEAVGVERADDRLGGANDTVRKGVLFPA